MFSESLAARQLFIVLLILAWSAGCVRSEPDRATGEVFAAPDSADLPNKHENDAGQQVESSQATATAPPSDRDRVRVIQVPHGGTVPDADIDTAGLLHLAYFLNDDIYYVRSPDGGKSFDEPIRVNDEAGFASGGAFRGPDVAVGENGRVHIVWYNAAYQQKRPKAEWGVMYSRLAPDSSHFEPARNLNYTPSDNFSLAADQEGNVAVIWMAGGVFANVSDDGGETFSPATDLQTDPCECCGSRAIFLDDDRLGVLYRDKADNDRDTYLALLSGGAGQVVHSKVSQTAWYIESCPMTGSFLAPAEHGLMAAWETKAQIYFARLDNRGETTAKGEIHVARRGRYPVVLAAADGVAVVAWKDGTALRWQLFDAKDVPTGEVGSVGGVSGDRPAGAVTRDGTFLLFP